ncbi:hypothetical protein SOVF_136370 [Spinacia oleracea]|nr:hypothetical protein SOVF_136370 [Spinacia oleracea]
MWKLKIAEGKDPLLVTVNNHIGRQHWEFDEEAGTLEERAEVERVREEFKRNRFKTRQSADLFMRMQVIALHITGTTNKILSPQHQKEIKRYIYNHQNEDGGWGLHIEGHSTMFGSAISYIALRLLGEGPDDGEDNAVARGRQWILDHGGATGIPSWGKFWLTTALLYSRFPSNLVGEKIEAERLYDAVNVILSLQSKNGGFPAWEPQRAFRWLEKFNPTEFFEDVLIEREYVECTSSAIQSLTLFKKLYPGHRKKEIERCIAKGLHYIEETQNPDGSWYGCWGICYTYGTWFGVEALTTCRKMNYYNSLALRKACHFLLSKQLPDGGWGENFLSSPNKVYTNIEGNKSNLVQTSWALLSLIKAGFVSIFYLNYNFNT